MSNDPKVYLSASEGRYRVIQGGIPVSADKRTAAEALAVAEHFRLKVSDKMWDGDAGKWRPLRTARDPHRHTQRGTTKRQRDPLSTKFRGVEVIGDTTVVKVDVYDGSQVIDGAWGQVHEIDAWLKRKGYPAVKWSKVPKRKPTALQKHLSSRVSRDRKRKAGGWYGVAEARIARAKRQLEQLKIDRREYRARGDDDAVEAIDHKIPAVRQIAEADPRKLALSMGTTRYGTGESSRVRDPASRRARKR